MTIKEIKKMSEIKSGEVYTVKGLDCIYSYYRKRLLAFGLVPGVKFKVLQVAPLGCPIEILLESGTKFSIRKKEGSILQVEKL